MTDSPISIKPEREYLHEILNRMEAGQYAVPLFQREYVWDKKQVLDLFDSVSKGYPIGSILLWRPKVRTHFPDSKNIVTDKIEENPNLDYFILDGRQRLTTFYGCLCGHAEADDRFNVVYDLEEQRFDYALQGYKAIWIVPLPELYDTFRLLDRLEVIQEQVTDKEKAKLYNQRAKRLNSLFQAYQIGELLFENYTLEEAGTVFARINSKGTDISKVSMLQALFYKEGQRDVLFSDWIGKVKAKLGRWGFERLRDEDILNCCYRYSDLKFYDHDLMDNIERLTFIHKLDEIEADLLREAEFLNQECGIISSSMLPYARQWVILAGAFKEKKSLTDIEKAELRKWLYYTTVCQTFMNSSLSVVRTQTRRFEKFISGESPTTMDYRPVKLPPLDFRFSLTSALSCLLMVSLVWNYRHLTSQSAVYLGYYRALPGSNPAGIIPYFSETAPIEIDTFMNSFYPPSIDLESLGLSENMLKAWDADDIPTFEELRKTELLKIEKELLESAGLELVTDKP